MADAEDKSMIEDDLEDGEIEDDEDSVVEVVPPPTPVKPAPVEEKEKEKKKSPDKKSSDSKKSSTATSSSRKERGLHDEDDFMSNIESQIANVLKKEGVEPPMPNIKRPEQDSDGERKATTTSRNSRKRRRRKERRDREKRENPSTKKRSKLNDGDNLYMVGGSPDHSDQSDSDDTDYSSYDSEEYHRSAHDERRNRRRDKYTSRAERERDRDRERDRKDRRKERDNEKEVCLRFAEFGHCPDDDCTRSHEVRQPKKMELCKFWLMECCAKKDKCSYMHGDFPCKFYYLGLKCVNKDCKFMHGKPLSENIKNILLKHLDTAPKEILGDFPRIGRENASKMIAQTHIKLCEEFNIPLPDQGDKNSSNSKIPSLLEMKLKPPEVFPDGTRKDSLSRASRWVNRDGDSPAKQLSPNSSATSIGPGDALLSEMKGILSDKQIESMAAVGVKTVNHINNLTVAQLNDIGLSLATIGEIQATAINMHNNMSNRNEAPVKEISEDVDMRVFPKEPTSTITTMKSPDTIMSPSQSDAEVQEIYKKPQEVPQQSSSLVSPPIDYSQYLRDSNLNENDEDEPGLKIDETYGSDYEIEEKKDSQSEDDGQSTSEPSNSFSIPLLPPSIIDTSAFLKAMPAKVDISSSIQQQLMEKEKPASRDPRSRDPRTSQAKTNDSIPEISSPTYKDPRQQVNSEQPRRTSIYEIESPSEDEDVQIKLSKDKDMRMPPFLRDSENGDVDFRFPFTPMANYVPATEIEASYGTFNFEKYEVKIIDIPRPDYSDIRRSFRQSEHNQDPRLKKLCTIKQESEKEEFANITLPSDPRKRKAQEAKSSESSVAPAGPKKLQITTILQNSKHYNELSSSQKMVVNDVLSELSKQLKLFHADQSPSKMFDTTFISSNPRLQQILIGLGVFVNAEGEFEEIKEFPMQTPVPQVVNLPNLHQMPPIVPSLFNQPPPANLMLQPPPNFLPTATNLVRPGILGLAPNLPFFDAQDAFAMNQPPPFANNDQMNFNRNQRQQQQSSSNNNFRNNSQRNSNYRNNRR